MAEWLYRPILLKQPKAAIEMGTDFVPIFYLPVTLATVRLIRGMLEYLDEPIIWQGTEAEIEAARDVLLKQIAEPVKTQSEVCGTPAEWGALFRTMAELLQEQQGEGLPPPPWEFRLDIRNGEYWLQYRTIPE